MEIIPELEIITKNQCEKAGYDFKNISADNFRNLINSEDNSFDDLKISFYSRQKEEARLKEEIRQKEVDRQKDDELQKEEARQKAEAYQKKLALEKEEFRQQELARKKEETRQIEETRQKEETQQKEKIRRNNELNKKLRVATSNERATIIDAIKKTLFDADTAKFGEMQLIPNHFACASVNAKNRFGGYTGFKEIILTYIEGKWYTLKALKINEDCKLIIMAAEK